MLKPLSIALISLISSLAYPSVSFAETVMERVAKTGVLTVGVRTDIVPYSYVSEQQELTGYSVEILQLIREQLEAELGKPVKLNYITSDNFSDRINSVISQEVDVVCDTIFTWERDQFVDFSLGYGISGIKLLVKKGANLTTAEDFKGKKIGFVANTLQERSINLLNSEITPVQLESLEAALTALQEGKVDGLAFDWVVLEGMRLTLDNPDEFVVIPENAYYNHGIACMSPQDDSGFLRLVNYSLIKMMDGYLLGDQRYTDLINRYFGENGIVPIDPQKIRNFFEIMVMTREQIPPTSSQAEK